jgi:uncharacterized protein (DUF1330 family)
MPGYFIARISVRNPDAYEHYRAKATATTELFGGRYLVRGAAAELREGVWDGRTVVIEFTDLATARAWYESPDTKRYIPIDSLRQKVMPSWWRASADLPKSTLPADTPERLAVPEHRSVNLICAHVIIGRPGADLAHHR